MLPEYFTASSQTTPMTDLVNSASTDNISEITTLRTKVEIQALLQRSRNFLLPLHITKISIAIEGLALSASSEIETRLNADLRECGCHAGGITASIGVLVYLALLIAVAGWPSAWKWKHLLIGIAFCFAMAVLGKLFGLLRARVRFVRGLELLWESAEAANHVEREDESWH
ncbi:MAG: hypothetical protein ICV60_03215 [Pyrinomonadaceae bacterium]|nr:hypothetical protein [Pyrinomonadaceae bacterium]